MLVTPFLFMFSASTEQMDHEGWRWIYDIVYYIFLLSKSPWIEANWFGVVRWAVNAQHKLVLATHWVLLTASFVHSMLRWMSFDLLSALSLSALDGHHFEPYSRFIFLLLFMLACLLCTLNFKTGSLSLHFDVLFALSTFSRFGPLIIFCTPNGLQWSECFGLKETV